MTIALKRSTVALKRSAALLALAATIAIAPSSVLGQDQDKQSPVPREQLRQAFALSDAFRAVSKSVGPSVVSIRSTQRMDLGNGPGQRLPMEEELLRRFFGQVPDMQELPPRIGQGSGVIVRPDGYIVTNNHVVENASEIKVQLVGQTEEHDAIVVGTDPESDLAVIRIENISGLSPVALGDSDALQVGDWVLAIGSPFGYDHSVTAGIVSAKSRRVGIIRDPRGHIGFEDFIQTDAAINPGNSGGPLVNLYGEVVGISSAISTRTGANVGIGFAIPSNMVKPVMESIIETGTVRRGALGVGIQSLTPDLAAYQQYPGNTGVVVSQVYPNSAAEKAGIEEGDIVTKLDGQPVSDTPSLMNNIARRAPGETVRVEIFRNGRALTRQVELGERAAQFGLGSPGRPGGPSAPSTSQELGLTVQNLTPELSQRLNAEDRTGVVVMRVAPDSIAGRSGFSAGDIISKVDDAAITNMQEFNAAISDADLSRGVALQVFRGGAARIVILKSNPSSTR
jgi:serine protease Do